MGKTRVYLDQIAGLNNNNTLGDYLDSLNDKVGHFGGQVNTVADLSLLTPVQDMQVFIKSENKWVRYNNEEWVNLTQSDISVNDLSDTNISQPQNKQVLIYDGTKWINKTADIQDVSGLQDSLDNKAENLNDLTDVNTNNNQNKDVLMYDGTQWINKSIEIVDINGLQDELNKVTENIDDLLDVDVANVQNGQVLTYDDVSNTWKASTPTSSVSTLSDVDLTSLGTGKVLVYDSIDGKWKPTTVYLGNQNPNIYETKVGIGGSTNKTYVVSHNLDTTHLYVLITRTLTNEHVYTDITYVDKNNISINFSTPPTSNEYTVVVGAIGVGGSGESSNLNGLSDVVINNPSVGQSLVYNGSVWVNGNVSGGSGDGATVIDELNDVATTNSTFGQVLQYDGANWTNQSLVLDDVEGLQDVIDSKANNHSPNLTGSPTAPTPNLNDSSGKIATTQFVQNQGYVKSSDLSGVTGDLLGIQSDVDNLKKQTSTFVTTFVEEFKNTNYYDSSSTTAISTSSSGGQVTIANGELVRTENFNNDTMWENSSNSDIKIEDGYLQLNSNIREGYFISTPYQTASNVSASTLNYSAIQRTSYGVGNPTRYYPEKTNSATQRCLTTLKDETNNRMWYFYTDNISNGDLRGWCENEDGTLFVADRRFSSVLKTSITSSTYNQKIIARFDSSKAIWVAISVRRFVKISYSVGGNISVLEYDLGLSNPQQRTGTAYTFGTLYGYDFAIDKNDYIHVVYVNVVGSTECVGLIIYDFYTNTFKRVPSNYLQTNVVLIQLKIHYIENLNRFVWVGCQNTSVSTTAGIMYGIYDYNPNNTIAFITIREETWIRTVAPDSGAFIYYEPQNGFLDLIYDKVQKIIVIAWIRPYFTWSGYNYTNAICFSFISETGTSFVARAAFTSQIVSDITIAYEQVNSSQSRYHVSGLNANNDIVYLQMRNYNMIEKSEVVVSDVNYDCNDLYGYLNIDGTYRINHLANSLLSGFDSITGQPIRSLDSAGIVNSEELIYQQYTTNVVPQMSNGSFDINGNTWVNANSLDSTKFNFPGLGNQLKVRFNLYSTPAFVSEWVTPKIDWYSFTNEGTGDFNQEFKTRTLVSGRRITNVKLISNEEENGGTISWSASNDDGSSWHNVTVGESFNFPNVGSELKLKANLQSEFNSIYPIIYSYKTLTNDVILQNDLADIQIALHQTNLMFASMMNATRYKIKNTVVDVFSNSSGIDIGKSSNYTFDSANKLVKSTNTSTVGNVVLVSETLDSQPSSVFISSDITNGTGNIVFQVSRDNGLNWIPVDNEIYVSLHSLPNGNSLVVKAMICGNATLNAIAYSWN